MNPVNTILKSGEPRLPDPVSTDEIRLDLVRLREIQMGLPEAAQALGKAAQGLIGLQVAEASFTSFTYSLALAYNEVEAYTLVELRARAEDALVFSAGVRRSGDTWQAAEDAGTVRSG